MADDTRQTQPDSNGTNATPSSSPKFVSPPPSGQSANIMPGGTQHTAGGEKLDPLTGNSLAQTFKPEDLLKVHQQPCAREAFLAGIGGGVGVGSLMAIWGKPVKKSCNWAVGIFMGTSLLSYEFLRRKRSLEKQYMTQAVELMDRKKEEKRKKKEEVIAARRKAKEEADRLAEEAKKMWWKLW
ncbi:hypothetical protein IWX90DRAFT_510808 [Phyllosticta citrichinensis]|uniref:Cytochrome c oxidase assembly protein COX20, mitochondrial n=1 Tax=Phyllosticta citrichinensis TaxID=1130410 RepID=A0ABR1Y1D6_9PEZI